MISCYASLYSMATIGLNRYIQICHPHKYKSIFTSTNTVLICLVIWVGSFISIVPTFFGWGQLSFDPKISYCTHIRLADYDYTVTMVGAGFIIPNSIIAVSYFKIYLHVRASKNAVSSGNDSAAKENKDVIQLAKTLMLVYKQLVHPTM